MKIKFLENDLGVVCIDTNWTSNYIDDALSKFYEFQGKLCDID